jgi:Ca2+-binding RTX toxin-like protein
MATVRLESVLVGRVGETDIYRVDLSQSGFKNIGAITIRDDNVLSGSRGWYSGMDLDFVRLLNSATDASTVAGQSGEPVFDFSPNGVVFQAGFQTPLRPGDPPEWNNNLRGTSGPNIYDPNKAMLGTANAGTLSLGEGGEITFLLKSALSTSGRYFYYGEEGNSDLAGDVLVSDVPSIEPRDFTLVGTSDKDTIRLGVGANTHLNFTNTTVYGRAGDDRIAGAFGNDTLRGETGKDWLSGASGNDWLHGGTNTDKVDGGSGNDTINGGAGNDRLSGSTGGDVFVFDSKLGTAHTDRKVNFDTITDFNVRGDSLWLDNAVFRKIGSGNLSSPGDLNKDYFITGSKAREKDDYLIYNKNTGVLSYDADGSGSKNAVEFAQLKKGLSLSYRDVFVI